MVEGKKNTNGLKDFAKQKVLVRLKKLIKPYKNS